MYYVLQCYKLLSKVGYKSPRLGLGLYILSEKN